MLVIDLSDDALLGYTIQWLLNDNRSYIDDSPADLTIINLIESLPEVYNTMVFLKYTLQVDKAGSD